MNFKRITSIVLSFALIGGPLGQSYAITTKAKGHNKTVTKKQNDGKLTETPSIYKDPIYWTILGGGAACLGYSLYKDYSSTKIQGTGLQLPTEYIGFDWNKFAKVCHNYEECIHNPQLDVDFPSDINDLYEQHIAIYMSNGTLRLRDFQLYILNNHINRNKLTQWTNITNGYCIGFTLALRADNFIHRHRNSRPHNDPHPELSNFDFNRFSAVLADCSKLGAEGENSRLSPDSRNFYLTLTDELTGIGRIDAFVTDPQNIQADKISHYMSQTGTTLQHLKDWINAVDLEIKAINNEAYRPRFTAELSDINFSSQTSGQQIRVATSDHFFDCNKNSGWRTVALDDNDKNIDVIKNRIDTIFGTDRIIRNRHSLCAYVFGTSRYDNHSRFNTLRNNHPDKIELFARILKVLPNLDQHIIDNTFKPTILTINGNCANEFSQYIDLLAGLLDQNMPNSINTSNIDDLADAAITTAKRSALKQSSDRVVLHFCGTGPMTAEYQINLYALLAPLFGLNDSRRFARYKYNGNEFFRWLNDDRSRPLTSLCNRLFQDCFEGIGENITQSISGISTGESETIYNAMGNVRVSYDDFKKILSSSYVSNRINSHRNNFFREASQDTFETRFDSFVNSLSDEDEEVRKLCTSWKNGSNIPVFKDIVNALLASDNATDIYELTMFNGYHNNPAGKAWIGDILIYVYLHCKGTISVR